MRKTRFLAILPALVALLACGCEPGDSSGDGTPFQVLSILPSDTQTNVPQNSTVTIRFSRSVDHRSIQSTKQIILADQQNSLVPISFSFHGEYVTLTPGTPLTANATYGVAVRPGVRDVLGNNIQIPFAATFSTGPALATIPNWPPFTIAQQGQPQPLGPPGTWTQVGPMLMARMRHCASRLLDGRVLVTGGARGPGLAGITPTAELMDKTLYTWSFSQANGGRGMYNPRAVHTSTLLLNGNVLITGGKTDTVQVLDSGEIYDPIADVFTLTPGRMNYTRWQHTATRLGNGNVLLVCGATSGIVNSITGTMYTDTMEIYDVYSGSFHLCTATMPVLFSLQVQQPGQLFPVLQPLPGTGGFGYHTSTLLPDNTVLITGGLAYVGAPVSLNRVAIYTPGPTGVGATGSLGTDPNRTLGRNRCVHTATLMTDGQAAGMVLIAGGCNPTFSCELFDYLDVHPVHGYKGTLRYTATNLSIQRRSHTANYIPSQAYSGRPDLWGKILLAGGGDGLGVLGQPPPYPPHNWIVGTSPPYGTNTSDLFDPFKFGINLYLPHRGLDQTANIAYTQDAQGNQTVIPSCLNRAHHTGTTLQNGSVLIAGGLEWIPTPFGPVPNVLNSTAVYNP